MQRQIFIGSSTEGLTQAVHISTVLCAEPDIKCVQWTEVFEPGFLTFESLEAVLLRCCGAVFVVRPDDHEIIRGQSVGTPRANIMLEFGLMAGRMGRHNIALCQYGATELPSDLKGLTVISMDPPNAAVDSGLARQQAEHKLQTWSSHLTATADRIARTEVVHGYTGRWEFAIELQTWRDVSLQTSDYVYVKGYLDLIMPPDGQTGRGLAHGTLSFKIHDGKATAYEGDYLTAHEVTSGLCLKDGSLELTTEAFALQKRSSIGEAPAPLAYIDFRPEPWLARWTLTPAAEPRTLTGEIHSEGSVVTRGRVRLAKSLPGM
jgi:hypothetical protein